MKPLTSTDALLPTAAWPLAHAPGALDRARRLLDALLVTHAVDARAVYACELVLEEWLTNVWRHGYQGAGGAVVELTAWVDACAVCLRFTDTAPAFDPLAAPEPERPGSLAAARPGGLGLQMIRQWAQDCRYRRVGGHNELTVWIARQAAG